MKYGIYSYIYISRVFYVQFLYRFEKMSRITFYCIHYISLTFACEGENLTEAFYSILL